MRILFCTDGSKQSFESISSFAELFKGIEVDILSVSDMTYFADTIFLYSDRIIEECSNFADKTIKSAGEFLSAKGIRVKNYIKKCGSAIDNILETESQGEYEYIVMGSRGKKGIQKWLGSVSQDVAFKSKTPVYISKNPQNSNNILFPVSPDMYIDNGLEKIIDKMDFSNKKVNLLSVYEMPDFLFLSGNVDSNWVTDIELKQQNEAVNLINSVEKLFINKGIDVKNKVVIKGNISDEILDFIENNSVSLTVLGMKNNKKKHSSVSRKVLEYAECNILIDKNI